MNIVVVNDAAANNPKNSPRGFNFISELIKLVANAVPIKTITTEIILTTEGAYLNKNNSNKAPIQTVCIKSTIAIETGMSNFTAK